MPRPSPPLLELDRVTLRRGERLCFRDTSWTIRAGETWAIVGPSGSGKSTLARALVGEIPLAAGEIRLAAPRRGRSAPSRPGEAVALVSFEAQLAHLGKASGYHQSRWHSGEDGEVPRARDLIAPRSPGVAALGLRRLLDRKITQLSNGERRKLLIARAAAAGPALLVLEDPFTGLDARSRANLLASLRRLGRGRWHMLFAISRPGELPREVTHVAVVASSRIVASGPRDEMLRGPAWRSAVTRTRGPHRTRPRPAHRTRSAGAPVIELRDVSIAYDRKRLLDRVTWTVRRGERWAVLGPNGAGKTTLLSLILADNPQAYAHRIELFGRPRGSGESIWEIKRRIGHVSPESHLFHDRSLTAAEVVGSGFHDAMGLRGPLTRAQAAATRAWLRRLDLERRARTPLHRLSEGEQRLALLGRALVKRPELLVLDEPCQGLDAASRARFLELLDRALRRPGGTLIHVTHELDELPHAITHALVLRRGRVTQRGAARDVLPRAKKA